MVHDGPGFINDRSDLVKVASDPFDRVLSPIVGTHLGLFDAA